LLTQPQKILDNADTLKLFNGSVIENGEMSSDLSIYLPRGASILWTSRDAHICGTLIDYSQGINVGAMSDDEALQLLRSPLMQRTQSDSAMKEPPSDDEAELLECLERLPLAIAHAAAFTKQTSKSVGEYLRIFKSERAQKKLLSFELRDHTRYRDVCSSRSIVILDEDIALILTVTDPDRIPNRFQPV
jgi:hypothetical protein